MGIREENQFLTEVRLKFRDLVKAEMKKKKLSYRDLSSLLGKEEQAGYLYKTINMKTPSKNFSLITAYRILSVLKLNHKIKQLF